jgi:hypothetical protein
MIYKNKSFGKIFFYHILFLLPLFQYLNKNNLELFIVSDVIYFFFSVLLLQFLIGMFHIIFLKKYEYPILFLILLFNLSFYFLAFRDYFLLNKLYSNTISLSLTVFIFTLFFLTPIFFGKQNLFKKFLVRLSLGYFLISYVFILINKESVIYNFKELTKDRNLTNVYNIDNIEISNAQNKSVSNIYYIIADAMLPLEIANDLNYISKGTVQNEKSFYKENQFTYIEESFTNYDTTQLTLAAILNLDYYTKGETELTYTKADVFPKSLYESDDHPLLQILNHRNFKFFHYGNEWGPCKQSIIVNCFSSKPVQIINRVLLSFYSGTPFYFFHKFFKIFQLDVASESSREIDNFIKQFSKKKIDNNNFFFIHHYSPHSPYDRDKNCLIKNYAESDISGYINSYGCVLIEIRNFINFINTKDPNALVVIQADHGLKHYKEKNIKYSSPIFNLIKYPENCDKFEKPKSSINSIRFALNCTFNTNFENTKFIFYEDGYDFPNAKFLLKKHTIDALR